MTTSKLADLEKAVEDYNKGVDKGAKLAWTAIQKKLAREGANESTLGHVTEAELVELTGLGKLTVRALIVGWAAGAGKPTTGAPAHASGGPAIEEEKLTLPELTPAEWIVRFDPARPDTRVAKLLAERFPRGFVLWRGTEYAKVETIAYVTGLAANRPVDPMVDGIVVTPRLPGWSPNPSQAPRNPIYTRQALREPAGGGTAIICGVTRESYADVSDPVRSFMILGAEMGEIAPSDPELARLIIDRARAASKSEGAFTAFRQGYQRTAAAWAGGRRGALLIDLTEEAGPGGRSPLGGNGPASQTAADVVVIYNVTDNADSRIARSLLTHLAPLKRQGVTIWDHDSIPLGADVDTAYADAIRTCKLLVLGLSASLLASPIGEGLDVIVGQSQQLGFGVMPVRFGHVDLRDTPFARFQMFPRSGHEGRVVSSSNLDEDMAEVAREIRESLAKKGTPSRTRSAVAQIRLPLSQDDVHAIHTAAINAGLARQRDALFVGIDQGWVAGLPETGDKLSQLLVDLSRLNTAQMTDGSQPLAAWLQNAAALAAGRTEAAVFERYLTPAAPNTGTGRRRLPERLPGDACKDFNEALRAAFRSRSDLKMMVRDQLDWFLDDHVASDVNLTTAVQQLIEYAESQSAINDLLAGAIKACPGNVRLSAFATKYAR